MGFESWFRGKESGREAVAGVLGKEETMLREHMNGPRAHDAQLFDLGTKLARAMARNKE